jgi:hypothetical protein
MVSSIRKMKKYYLRSWEDMELSVHQSVVRKSKKLPRNVQLLIKML